MANSAKHSFQKAGDCKAATSCCELKDELTLESTYALEQLQQIALRGGRAFFIERMKEVFKEAYSSRKSGMLSYSPPYAVLSSLYDDAVVKNEAINPKIVVISKKSEKKLQKKIDNKIDGLIEGKLAAYDKEENVILISRIFLCQVMMDNSKKGELLVALVEEFGHHLDYLIQEKYGALLTKTIHGDVGARYAATIVKENHLDSFGREIANEFITINTLAKNTP